MDMKKLLEAVTKFAGEPEQKPGDQVRGTDKAKTGSKQHPFKGKLVGDSKDNMLKGLSQVSEDKSLEWKLAEAFVNFNEDDIGVEPKRPARKGSRPSRPYTKNGKPSKRYTPVEEGWNTGNDRVSLPDTPHTYWSGTGALQKEYDVLYNELVPSQGKADTIEGEVLRASSKIVYRHYNDGDEFNEASFDQLTPYIGTVTSYDDLAHKAIEFALKANGNYTPNPDWDSLDVMDYGPAEEEEYDDEEDEWEDEWPDDDEELEESTGTEIFTDFNTWKKAATALMRGKASIHRDYTHPPSSNNPQIIAVDLQDGTVTGVWDDNKGTGTVGQTYVFVKGSTAARADGQFKYSYYKTKAPKAPTEPKTYANEEVDEGRGDSKGLHKKVTIVKGRDAGKTGYVRQIKTDKIRNRVYLDLDLEDGGQAVVLKQDVRLVKDVEEARTTWNNDFYVYDPETKVVKKKFRTHRGAKQYAEANGLKVASAEYYHDTVSKEVEEGWESGPEERTRVERDPDAEYDARRQEKLDAPYAQKEPEAKGYLVVSLDTRQPVTDEVFPTKGHAMAYIQSNHSKNLAYRAINEGIESGDPVESAVLSAVQELIQQGHTEVAPEVITNMVVAATSQPFLLKDLVDCNNNSPAIQHYVDSINPTKVKFSNEILTVKNEDPMKDKKQAQAGVSSMAARAASRNRLGETKAISELSTDLVTKVGTARAQQLAPHVASNSTSPDRLKFAIKKNKAVDNLLAKSRAANEKGDTASAQQAVAGVRKIRDTVDGISESSTPLRDREDYQAKNKALQDIQMDPHTHQDSQLSAELARRKAELVQQAKQLGISESRAHKLIANKLKQMELQRQMGTPESDAAYAKHIDSVKKSSAEYVKNTPNTIYKREVEEAGSAIGGSATSSAANAPVATNTATTNAEPVDVAVAKNIATATSTLKTATGSTAPTTSIAKALDAASQGKGVSSTDMRVIEPLMKDLTTVAQDPKLANQFKTLASQVNQTQKLQQQVKK